MRIVGIMFIPDTMSNGKISKQTNSDRPIFTIYPVYMILTGIRDLSINSQNILLMK